MLTVFRFGFRFLRAAKAVWHGLANRQVPLSFKLVPALAVAYLLWPRDVVPDVVPLIGRLDDLILLYLALSSFLRLSAPWAARTAPRAPEKVVEGSFRVVKTEPRS